MAAATPRHPGRAPLAGPLSGAPPRPERRARAVIVVVVLLLHALALQWLAARWQPPSLLRPLAPPLYTRTLTPQAPIEVTPKSEPKPVKTAARRPRAAITNIAKKTPDRNASTPPPQPGPAPEPEPADTPAAAPPADASAPDADAAPPDDPDADGEPAFLAHWPADTRLRYKLGGHYRGELHGSAEVTWQRQGTRYQTAVDLGVGLLLSLSFASQGAITADGLHPEVYEEQVRQRRRGVRLDADAVRLNNGERVPRPRGVQDTASQFVELGHRFATGQARLEPGGSVRFWLARPGGVDEWIYDMVGEETLHLPRLGPVRALHLRPRALDQPRGPLTAEIWYAPSLQYLPVRIRITSDADNYVDLLVDTIEQR